MSDPAGSLGTKSTDQLRSGFTVIELLVVMTIILVLAGLVLGTSGYVHNKAARSRAEAEINGLSAALENYKADNGIYPPETSTDARTSSNPTAYNAGSLALYKALSGDMDGDRGVDPGAKSYFTFKDSQLYPPTTAAPNTVQYIQDPFGYCYGYSTINSTDPTATKGYNPTFDLWSTSGSTAATGALAWVKNW